MRQLIFWFSIIFSAVLLMNILVLSRARQEESGAYWVAYEELINANYDFINYLNIMSPDGHIQRRMDTNRFGNDFAAMWTPNYHLLYVNDLSMFEPTTYQMSLRSKQRTVLLDNAQQFAFSPDNVYMTYLRNDDLEVAKRQTEELVMQIELRTGPGLGNYDIYWLADNQSFIFFYLSAVDLQDYVYHVNLTNQEATLLNLCELDSEVFLRAVSVAPNGEWMVLDTGNSDGAVNQLILCNLETDEKRILSSQHMGRTNAAKRWSPDSQWFVSWDQGILYLDNIDPAKSRQINSYKPIVRTVTWSPDGRGFYYIQDETRSSSLYRRDAHGQNPILLREGIARQRYFQLPVPSPLIDFAWHPLYLALLGGLLFIMSVSVQIVYRRIATNVG